MGVRTLIARGAERVAKAFGPGVPESFRQGEIASQMTPASPFSPGQPISPYDGYDRTPRSRDFVTGYNIATRPRVHERVSFETLKGLIEAYDIAQLAIMHRIDSIRALDWKLIAADDSAGDVSDAIRTGMAALEKPDREHYFDNWFAMWAWDVLAYDAGSLYRMRNRAGRCTGLRVVSGPTIAPLLDYWGNSPAPASPGDPEPEAYVQFANGLPWNWLTRSDLIYEPFRPRPDSPYGHAPLESIILNANTDLRFQVFFLQRFTEGNLPAAFASAPDTWSPEQIEQFQEYWDSFMYGDQSRKAQVRWMPPGSKFVWSNEKDFSDVFSLFLMRKSLAAYHVVPADMGFTENVNRSSGESQADVQHRLGDAPLARYCSRILTGFLQHDLGLPLKHMFDLGEEQDDRVAQAQADKLYVDMGAIGSSEIREMRYGRPEPQGRPVPRFINSSRQGPIPLAALFAVAGEIDPETGAPVPGSELPHVAFGGIEGVIPNPPLKLPSLAEQEFGRKAIPPAPPPQPIEGAPVAKDGAAPGVTAETGIYGDPLIRGDDEDEDEAAVAKEMAAFRRFRAARLKSGKWRDFGFAAVGAAEAGRLNAEGRAQVAKAVTSYGPPADPRDVYAQMAGNFRAEGIAWVLDCPWQGPCDVPLSAVDTGDEDSWAASEPGANAAHVAAFAARIEAGDDPDPAVMVHVPGQARLKVADGHHRYEADASLGRPARAWVGFPAGDDWQETHSFQLHSGGSPLNKAAGDCALCFILFRAPNRDGKLRYLLQKRGDGSPSPGTWGLPGGHAHTGEDPWQAAVRETSEELGPLPPLRRGPALAWDQGGQTVHTFLVQLPQMFTPDMAGSATPGESAGWGWFSRRQVGGLDLHPAMARTWRQVLAAGLDGPGSDWAAVSKAAITGPKALEAPRPGRAWADAYDRRRVLLARHQKAVAAAWDACLAEIGSPRDAVREFRSEAAVAKSAGPDGHRWWKQAGTAAALAWLQKLYAAKGWPALVAALEAAIADGMAQGQADALALAADRQGIRGFSVAAAFTAAAAALQGSPDVSRKARDTAGAIVAGAAADAGQALADSAQDGGSGQDMTGAVRDATAGGQSRSLGQRLKDAVWGAIAAGVAGLVSRVNSGGQPATGAPAAPGAGPGPSQPPTGPDYFPPPDTPLMIAWYTDGRPCPACLDIEAGSPYAPQDVPSIPVHPHCQCDTAPYNDVPASYFAAYLLR